MNSIMDIIYIPFGYLVRFFDKLCGGQYILTLLLFSLAVKILMLPFSIKQQKNQIKGAKLRPKMALIEKKYAGRTDQKTLQKKQQELMALQQQEGYSPLAGCLPLLIQFPVLIGLYQVIRCPLTYIARFSSDVVAKINNVAISLGGSYSGTVIENTTDVAWKTVKNLNQIGLVDSIKQNPQAFESIEGFSTEAIPNFEVFGGWMNLAETPSFKFSAGANPWLLLIPLLTFLGSFATMKLTKKFSGNLQAQLNGQTPQQQQSATIMEWMMPLMSLWFAFILSAAMGVYWVYNSIFSLVQMVILNKLMPMPTFTAEEIRAYEKSLKQKPKSQREFDPDRPKPRSLHHIDDDE